MSETKSNILEWTKFLRKGIGYFAFTMHRISGVVIVAYLYLHYYELSHLLMGQATYDSVIKGLTYGPYGLDLLLDVLLALVIFYHGANGIRLVLNEMGLGLKQHKLFFYIFESVAVIVLIVFLYYAWLYLAVGL